jgi:REP element-mobilizing transposase RayT
MNPDDLRFLDPHADPRITENRLPHWEQEGRTYFVTFRTSDSLPAQLMGSFEDERHAWLASHPMPWSETTAHEYWERFGQQTEKWLDQCHGACVLRQPEVAEIVAGALRFHEGTLCTQHAWVVMPNHVHALFSLSESATLAKLLHSWKSFTAKAINCRTGAIGAFWQKDYFDRLIRSPEHLWRCARYIRKNPANLHRGESLLWEADWIAAGLDA